MTQAPIDNGHFTPESQLTPEAPAAPVAAPINAEPAAPEAPAEAAPPKQRKPRKDKKPPKEKKVYEESNGVKRPDAETICGRIWAIADKLSFELRQPPTRGQVMEIATGEGINPATVATQYGRWRTFNGVVAQRPKKEPSVPTEQASEAPAAEPMHVEEAAPAPVMEEGPAAPEVAPANVAPAKGGKRGKAAPMQ